MVVEFDWNKSMKIQRHKAAIRRNGFSLPIKCLFRDGLISPANSLFDFGCGHGENVTLLQAQLHSCKGWDPVFFPHQKLIESDVVNLGYVINVIEDLDERMQTLHSAWNLTSKLLVVSARVQVPGRGKQQVEFGDGIITRIGTFQKYYTQAELRTYIESTLGVDALPSAIGIFYVFKDEEWKQRYVANRYRRRSTIPRKRLSELKFEQHRELLDPLMQRITDLGRLPHEDEFDSSCEVLEHFGSMKRAFRLIKRVTGEEDWENIGKSRTEDLLVYLALARFEKRPALKKLPIELQRDIKAFFRSYKVACQMADLLLFRAGDPEAIDDACKHSEVGKLLPNALYVHKSAINTLEPLLRIFEGCARSYLGEIEDTNIVKLHRFSGKISYLAYPDFDKKPHPELIRSVKLSLRTLDLDCYDYSESKNPPVLHRKETFLADDHPYHDKFARLTRQEEKNGLLEETATIGTRNGWQIRLDEFGFKLKGHRLVRKKPASN